MQFTENAILFLILMKILTGSHDWKNENNDMPDLALDKKAASTKNAAWGETIETEV